MSGSSSGRPSTVGARAAAILLACIGVALVLGVAARSAGGHAPSFAAAKSYRTGGGPQAVAVADVNGDAKPDVATVNFDSSTASLFFNEGHGRLLPKHDYRTAESPSLIAIENLNGDTAPDLVTSSFGVVSVLLNRGDGSFLPRVDYRAGGTWLEIADLNGDQRPDLVGAAAGGRSVSVLLNKGDGGFGKHDYAIAPEVTSLAVGDVNRDGAPDVAASHEAKVSEVSVLLNHGDGTFEAKRDYPTGDTPGSLSIADLNGDGWADLVMGRRALDLPSWVSVLLNRGDGSFGPKRSYRSGKDSNTTLGVADLNADGALDLAVVNGNNTLSVLLNRGDGSFAPARYYRSFLAYGPLAVRDLNGDGAPDLVLESWDLGTVSAYLNRGDGLFTTALEYVAGDSAASLAIADLNGDAAPDLVAGRDDENRVSVLINTPGLCNVQYVVRMKLATAKRALARVNCGAGRVSRSYSKVKAGLVLSQKPKFGTVRPKGGKVDLVISTGRRK